MKNVKEFGKLCKMTQKKLKKHLNSQLNTYFDNVINEDGYLYAKGDIPILLTAHMDTVHKVTCRKYYVATTKQGETAIGSKDGIGGDDRCGIYMILRLLAKGYKPSILFCEDEEVGGVGSNKFWKSKWIDDVKELNYMIELDRANANDAVFYECGNQDFIKFILETTGYKKAYGTFSDISHLSPATDIASVNLSCGYYNAHTTQEYVVMSEMENTIKVVEKLLETESEQYDYQEEDRWSYYSTNGYFSDGYLNSISKYYANKYGTEETETKRKEILEGVEFTFKDKDGKYVTEAYWGDTLEYCIGALMLEYPYLSLNDLADYEEIYW